MTDSLLLREFVKCRSDLERFLFQRLGSNGAAVDLAQDVYLRLCERPTPKGIQNPRAYLYRMAANLATDHTRSEQRRARLLKATGDAVWKTQDDQTPERTALAQAELAYMERAVSRLSERRRRVFYLSRYEGLTQTEIASRLSVGLTTVQKDLKAVMKTLLRARRRFADELD
ncbi:MAG: RNA polymerase sigma factor [Pseudomonadota bacterium]